MRNSLRDNFGEAMSFTSGVLLISALIGLLASAITYGILFGLDSLQTGSGGNVYCILPVGLVMGVIGGILGSNAGKKYLSKSYGIWAGCILGAVIGGTLGVPLALIILLGLILFAYEKIKR